MISSCMILIEFQNEFLAEVSVHRYSCFKYFFLGDLSESRKKLRCIHEVNLRDN